MIEEQTAKRSKAKETVSDDSDITSAGAMNVPISDVAFSVRVRSCLERLGVVTLADVIALSEEKLLSCKNFGQTSLDEVKQLLGEHGLNLAGS